MISLLVAVGIPLFYILPEDLKKLKGNTCLERHIERENQPSHDTEHFRIENYIKADFWDKSQKSKIFVSLKEAKEFASKNGYAIFICSANRVVLLKEIKATVILRKTINTDEISEMVSNNFQSLKVIIYNLNRRTIINLKGNPKDVDKLIKILQSIYGNYLLSIDLFPSKKLACG